MNYAAIRIHKKYHGNDSKIKLPLWAAGLILLTVTSIVSAAVSVSAANARIGRLQAEYMGLQTKLEVSTERVAEVEAALNEMCLGRSE